MVVNANGNKISFKKGETILNKVLLFLEQQGDSFNANSKNTLHPEKSKKKLDSTCRNVFFVIRTFLETVIAMPFFPKATNHKRSHHVCISCFNSEGRHYFQ